MPQKVQASNTRVMDPEKRIALLERRLRLVLDSASDAILIADAGGAVVFANTAMEELSGYSRAELAGVTIGSLLPPECDEPLRCGIVSVATSPVEIDAELIARDASRLPVRIRVDADPPGKPETVQYTIRKREPAVEVAECCRELRFPLMARNVTEMVVAYDMDRRLAYANAATETLTGYSVAELVQGLPLRCLHPDERPRVMELFNGVFAGKSFHDEHRLLTRDGRVKWIASSWGPVLDGDGRQIGVQGRAYDITDRRMAEETLRHTERCADSSEERYRTLFEESPFAMWEKDFSRVKQYVDELARGGVTDLKTHFAKHPEAIDECRRRVRVVDVNRAAREFYGFERKAELIGNHLENPPCESFEDQIAAFARNQSTFQTEVQVQTRSGEERSVSMLVSLAPTPERDWSRVLVSFFDITDRKRLEAQILQSQKLESLGRLAGGVAHDFNNLLTVINGYSDLLLRNAKDGTPLHRGLTEIHNAGAHAAELTQQLLAFSRKQPLKLQAVCLNSLIEDSKAMLHRLIGEDVRLSIKLDPACSAIKADRGQMLQVLMNLVVNAREAMPNGGALTVETICAVGGRHSSGGSRHFAILRIGDTGIGMDAATKERLFEPFFTTKHDGRGTGLGLSTVFGIVSQIGGRIEVASEPGQGATFDIFLPCADGPGEVREPESPRSELARGSGAILLVEDQIEVRTLAGMILRNQGYQVLEAGDGLEAMAIMQSSSRPVRLLLTDVVLPGMNGLEVAQHLLRACPDMKVVYMSGYTDGRLSPENGSLFLDKPFTPAQLTGVIERALAE